MSEGSVDDGLRLRAGEARLIVLPDRQLRGAGRSRGNAGGDSGFFLRSSSG